jgi:spore germination protein
MGRGTRELEMESEIQRNLYKNIEYLDSQFKNCSDIVFRHFLINGTKAVLIFVDGLIDNNSIQFNALHELLVEAEVKATPITQLEEKIVSISQVQELKTIGEVIQSVLDGNTVLLADRMNKALALDAKGGTMRSVAEPETEATVRGPREGFNESLRVGTSLIRRKIRSPNLKFIAKKVGAETQTNIAIAYIEGIASPDLLKEVEKRIDRIEIDGILESNYIEELIEDNPWSIFPQMQYTERPDTVAANLLEGRVAIIVDGTPFVLILPTTFWQLFQASEDYYQRYHISFFIRWIRLIFLILALYLPAIYIAILTYHQEMMPTTLLLSVAASREAIPFPAFVEAMIMEIAFEALREAGIRLPKTIGQAVSILGALVIGTAAVEAGIVSAPMVIIVSITGIASFTIPRFNLAISIRLLRFPMMFLAATFGLFGLVIGLVLLSTHLFSLRSFGVPFMAPTGPISVNELKDVFIRMPWWAMKNRPKHIAGGDYQRESDDLMPSPLQGKEK